MDDSENEDMALTNTSDLVQNQSDKRFLDIDEAFKYKIFNVKPSVETVYGIKQRSHDVKIDDPKFKNKLVFITEKYLDEETNNVKTQISDKKINSVDFKGEEDVSRYEDIEINYTKNDKSYTKKVPFAFYEMMQSYGAFFSNISISKKTNFTENFIVAVRQFAEDLKMNDSKMLDDLIDLKEKLHTIFTTKLPGGKGEYEVHYMFADTAYKASEYQTIVTHHTVSNASATPGYYFARQTAKHVNLRLEYINPLKTEELQKKGYILTGEQLFRRAQTVTFLKLERPTYPKPVPPNEPKYQAIYLPFLVDLKAKKKYDNALVFSSIIPKIRKYCLQHCGASEFHLIIYIICITGIRIGGGGDKDETDSFGCIDLLKQNIEFISDENSRVRLHFFGKSQIEYNKTHYFHPLAYFALKRKVFRKRNFQKVFTLSYNEINDAFSRMLPYSTPKQFRTALASKIVYELLKSHVNSDESLQIVKEAIAKAGYFLNHTDVKALKKFNHIEQLLKKYDFYTAQNMTVNDWPEGTQKAIADNYNILQNMMKDEKNKSVRVETTEKNYIDPRIIFSFAAKNDKDVDFLVKNNILKLKSYKKIFKWVEADLEFEYDSKYLTELYNFKDKDVDASIVNIENLKKDEEEE